MCMFCAAIPAAMAVGASAHNRQREERGEAEARGEQPARPKIPAGPATIAVIAALVLTSAVYHITLNS